MGVEVGRRARVGRRPSSTRGSATGRRSGRRGRSASRSASSTSSRRCSCPARSGGRPGRPCCDGPEPQAAGGRGRGSRRRRSASRSAAGRATRPCRRERPARRCGSRRGRRSRRSPGTARMASAARGTASAPASLSGSMPPARRGPGSAGGISRSAVSSLPCGRRVGSEDSIGTKVAAAAVEAAGVAPSATARPPGANPPTAPRDLMRSARISRLSGSARLPTGSRRCRRGSRGSPSRSSCPATAYRRSRTSRRRGSWSSPS